MLMSFNLPWQDTWKINYLGYTVFGSGQISFPSFNWMYFFDAFPGNPLLGMPEAAIKQTPDVKEIKFYNLIKIFDFKNLIRIGNQLLHRKKSKMVATLLRQLHDNDDDLELPMFPQFSLGYISTSQVM